MRVSESKSGAGDPTSADSDVSQNRLLRFAKGFAIFAALVVLPLYAYKVWHKTDYTDFLVYYRAASRAARGDWAGIYSLKDGASPFRYAPITIPFFRPFAELTLQQALLVWYFLQYLWFGAGFYFIYLTLKRVMKPSKAAPAITALSMLFILRLCLDCFTIGQISSLLFTAYCISFYAWVRWQSGRASTALLLPSLVKIGPGFLYPLFLHGRPKARLRAVIAPIVTLAAVLVGTSLWLGPWQRIRMLWSGWFMMVRDDSVYYDASNYGSQSVKSALLRMVNWHWISHPLAMRIYVCTSVILCGAVLLFWLWRVPRRPLGRAASFALGIFPYLWVMPETFKYSQTVLAIPVALLFADTIQPKRGVRRSRFTVFALIFGVLTISLAGKDVVGDFLFFGSQKASIPLLAMFFLGIATALLAWRESRDSSTAREIKSLFRSYQVAPWEQEQAEASVECSLLAPLPMQSATSVDASVILDFIRKTDLTLERICPQGHEILLQPYGDRLSEFNPCWQALQELSANRPRVRLLPPQGASVGFSTRNAALRGAFIQSRGHRILTAQLEQPCDPEFYERAIRALDQGMELVRGNRRMKESRFRIPVRLLSIVYQRHRLGLWFNRIVRFLVPIETRDTHSGILAMSRSFATEAFALQSTLDFLFDLELALVAKTHEIRQVDLPLILYVAEEKTHHRMFLEALNIFFGLPWLARRFRKGYYSRLRLTQAFTADDWGLTPEVNQGILELAQKGVIRRVSLMARSSYLTSGLTELMQVPGIELGLHFDLTFGKSSPGQVLLSWLSPFANRKGLVREVQAEFHSQLKTLKDAGVPIQYVDGHHHIHLVPGILDALAEPIQQAGIKRVRCPYDPSLWPTPKAILNILSLMAEKRIRTHGFSSLPCFYPQHSHFTDPGLFRASLARNPSSEIIVHPARSNDLIRLQIPDSYTDGRVIEYRALRMLGLLSR